MIQLITAISCKEMIKVGCPLIENIFGQNNVVLTFVNNVNYF